MKVFVSAFLLLTSLASPLMAQQKSKALTVESGVSLNLARMRAALISDVQYDLHFDIPEIQRAPITASGAIHFHLEQVPELLQLDFKQKATAMKALIVNGSAVEPRLEHEHLLIDPHHLKKGSNTIKVEFIAGNESLNRNQDYLYALFVPDRARLAFPCFDQPDLKANFKLRVTVPAGWQVLANGLARDSVITTQQSTFQFDPTEKLPTYLFSFTAGKFKAIQQLRRQQRMTFLHRETDPGRISWSVDSIFIAHQQAMAFLENWTGIPYPFQKVGFAAIPDFQFGGMEHPGAIQYKASVLFLGEGATRDQFIARSNLISHEVAHMWFGDLVTMKWFNDVWMKEVFANFIADKITEQEMGTATFNMKFLQDHYPAAYGIDRSRGANPIRQQLDNLQQAGSMYGNIIYHKAPLMMRQLESLMGAENFQAGIRAYLHKYAYQNATWDDLIALLSTHTSADLHQWNDTWVNQPGRPVFEADIRFKELEINRFTIKQRPESGKQRTWPQRFKIRLFYESYIRDVLVEMKDNEVRLDALHGLDKPKYMLYNADGMGYGLFPVDRRLMEDMAQIDDPLARASAYINAYENTLSGRAFLPEELLELFSNNLITETNEMNLRLISNYISNIYWSFIPAEQRAALSPTLENNLWHAMEQQSHPNRKKILFYTYQNIYQSNDAQQRLYAIWKRRHAPDGVKLMEDDYTALALSIALKNDSAEQVLEQELQRIPNEDRKARLRFLMPALSSDVKVRDAFFESLKQLENRKKEAWVNTALAYLHHPLRQHSSIRYLRESLDMLTEIQRTGDIFFPQSWLTAILATYQSKEADEVVQDFLKEHPDYNDNLKGKILQASDQLYRNQHVLQQRLKDADL